jgi:hypothetical protein
VAKGDQAGDENRASSGGGKVADEKEQVGGTAKVPQGSERSTADQQNRQHAATPHQTGAALEVRCEKHGDTGERQENRQSHPEPVRLAWPRPEPGECECSQGKDEAVDRGNDIERIHRHSCRPGEPRLQDRRRDDQPNDADR